MTAPHDSLTIRIVRTFLDSNLSMVFILVSIAAGVAGPAGHPARGGAADHRGGRKRDGVVSRATAPGTSSSSSSTPLEKMLYQIPGVEYVYSRSLPGPEHRHGAVLRRPAARAQLVKSSASSTRTRTV